MDSSPGKSQKKDLVKRYECQLFYRQLVSVTLHIHMFQPVARYLRNLLVI